MSPVFFVLPNYLWQDGYQNSYSEAMLECRKILTFLFIFIFFYLSVIDTQSYIGYISSTCVQCNDSTFLYPIV